MDVRTGAGRVGRWRAGAPSVLGMGALLLALLPALLFAPLGFAPKQLIPLYVSPAPSQVFLDKEPLEESPSQLELRADRDHTLFFKRAGYRSELVVLETREIDGKERLVPERVELRLRPLSSGTQDLEVELEAD
jgi:hypothetical protein